MSRRTITIIVVAAVLVAGYFGIRALRRSQQSAATLSNLQTEEAQIGSLVATVGATGTVRANQTALLIWQTSGTVEQVNAATGDKVEQGDTLASLLLTSLSQNVILAQADLVSAERALEDLYDGTADLALAQAALAVAQAQEAVESAQRALNSLNSPAEELDIEQARANVSLAQNRLNQARKNYAPYENKPDSVIRSALLNALAQAQNEYDNAVRLLNSLLGTASANDLSVAEANLQVALAQLAEAEAEYERLAGGPNAEDVAVAEARVAAARATLKLSRIEAPFAGTITKVQPKPGDLVTGGASAFRLDDLSRLLVDVEVSEIDINRIAVGQEASVSFDAILATEYHGTVVEVAPVGEIQQGVVNFLVTVELTDADELVKPGMTAAVNIVVSQLEDALLVPNRAVRVLNGERVVYVLRANNTLEPVQITLGASSEMHSQVLEGDLQTGDLVVLNPPTNFEPGPGGGPGGGPFGGGDG